jgi:hypothetical protein
MAGALSNLTGLAPQLEAAKGAVYPLFERSSKTMDLLKGKKLETSSRSARVVFNIAPPGNFGHVDLDGGDLGRGGGSQYINGNVSPVDLKCVLEVTKKVEISTNSDSKSLADVVRRDIKNAPKEMAWGLDALMQVAGTGQLSVLSSGSATTTWTLSGAFKTLLLHRGLQVELYDSTFATKRSGIATVLAINYAASTVTVDAIPAGATDGDLIVVQGMTGANPVSILGLPYYNNGATSGTIIGLTRSLFPELQTPFVDAGASQITPQFIRAALTKLRLKRDDDSLENGLKWHMNPIQVDAWEQNAAAIMNIEKSGSAKEKFELFFEPSAINGIPIVSNIKADPTRIDGLMTSRWFRVVSKEVGFYQDPGEGATAYPIYGPSGGRAAATGWALIGSMQVATEDPGAGCYVSNLAKPSLYP